MNPTYFCDPLTFYIAPPGGQILHSSKYLTDWDTIFTDIHGSQMMCHIDFLCHHEFVVFSDMSQWQWWNAMKCGTHIHVPCRMNWNNFYHFLAFPLAPSSGSVFNLSNTLVYAHIAAKRDQGWILHLKIFARDLLRRCIEKKKISLIQNKISFTKSLYKFIVEWGLR